MATAASGGALSHFSLLLAVNSTLHSWAHLEWTTCLCLQSIKNEEKTYCHMAKYMLTHDFNWGGFLFKLHLLLRDKEKSSLQSYSHISLTFSVIRCTKESWDATIIMVYRVGCELSPESHLGIQNWKANIGALTSPMLLWLNGNKSLYRHVQISTEKPSQSKSCYGREKKSALMLMVYFN